MRQLRIPADVVAHLKTKEMKRTFIIFLFGLTLGNVFGQIFQSKERRVTKFPLDTSEACNPKMIFVIVEKMPEYKGGLAQLEKDLNERFVFGKEVSGDIYFSVYINCENYAYAFQVLRGIDAQTDKKLTEELKALQNWTSGIQKNSPVNCNKTLGFKIINGRITIPNKY
jgi:hypothetical protein